MKEIIFVVEEAPEGGYIAKALGASIITQAKTPEELYTSVCDAVHCHFDAGRKAEPRTGSAEWELWMNFVKLGRCVHFSADHIPVSALQ